MVRRQSWPAGKYYRLIADTIQAEDGTDVESLAPRDALANDWVPVTESVLMPLETVRLLAELSGIAAGAKLIDASVVTGVLNAVLLSLRKEDGAYIPHSVKATPTSTPIYNQSNGRVICRAIARFGHSCDPDVMDDMESLCCPGETF